MTTPSEHPQPTEKELKIRKYKSIRLTRRIRSKEKSFAAWRLCAIISFFSRGSIKKNNADKSLGKQKICGSSAAVFFCAQSLPVGRQDAKAQRGFLCGLAACLRKAGFSRVISFFSFRPQRRTRRKGESKAFLCGLPAEGRLSAKNPFATVAKNPPSPLNKGELHPWVSQPLSKIFGC